MDLQTRTPGGAGSGAIGLDEGDALQIVASRRPRSSSRTGRRLVASAGEKPVPTESPGAELGSWGVASQFAVDDQAVVSPVAKPSAKR